MRRVLLAIALAILVVSVAPAEAAAGTVVVYSDDSDTDFQNGTLQGTVVSGTGSSAVVELVSLGETEGFEDGEFTSDWVGDTGGYSVVSDANTGTYGLQYDGTMNDIIHKDFPEYRYDTVSWAFKDDSLTGDPRPYFYLRNSTGADYYRIYISSGSTGDAGSVLFYSGAEGQTIDTGLDVTQNDWYTVEGDADWSANTVTINLYDDSGSLVGSESGLQFNDRSGGYSRFRVFGSNGYGFVVDDIDFSRPSGNGLWKSQNRTIEYGDRADVELDLSNATANASIEVWDGSSWTSTDSTSVSSSGNYSLAIDSTAGDKYRAVVELNTTGATPTAEIEGVTWHARRHAPAADESSMTPDGGTISESPVRFELNLSDSDFSSVDGELLNASVVDADEGVVGNDSLSGNGTAVVEWAPTGGNHDYYWQIEDSQGNQITTSQRSYSVPAILYIRNETDVSDLVDEQDAELTIRAYGGNKIVEKTSQDGKVNMTGFPVGEELVIMARANGYYSRRIIISSILEQESLYLLPESEPAVYNQFTTEDNTGLFSENTTQIRIEKGINNSSSTTWQTIAGDYKGAGSALELYLQQDARYRVFVENEKGDVRNLGPYIAASDGVVPLTIGKIEWIAPSGDTYKFEAYIDDSDTLRVNYADATGETDSLSLVIHERGNESNVLVDTSTTSANSYQYYHQLTANESVSVWSVELDAERDGETTELRETVGGVGAIDLPIDEKWLSLAALFLLVAIAGLLPSTLARIGAVVLVAIATGLAWFGWAPIPMPVIGIAGALALFGLAAQFRR